MGLVGSHPSEESRAKMSASHMGKKHPMRGHIVTPETCAKLSVIARARTIPLEQRAKISAKLKGRTLSLETRAKMSAAQMGNKKGVGHFVSDEIKAKLFAAKWKGGPKIARHRAHAKRRLFGFVPLNKPFVGSSGHHVDNEQVIYMPSDLHRSIYHNQHTGQGMAQINALAYEWLAQESA